MRYNDAFSAKSFVESLQPSERARFFALVQLFVNTEGVPTRDQAHFLEPPFDRIFELKPKKQRVFGFMRGNQLYLVHGAPKKKAREQRADYQIAETRRLDFLNGLNMKENSTRRGSP